MADSKPGWSPRSADGIDYYEFTPGPNLRLYFLTRRGGTSSGRYESLNLSLAVGDRQDRVEENYRRVRRLLRVPTIITLKQVHSNVVLPIAYDRIPPDLLEGDAAFTSHPDIGLGIKVADCLPVYVYDINHRCIGIAHCGWRGTAARIAEKLARNMSRRFSLPLTDLTFSLGPCICPVCYPVGENVREVFVKDFPAADKFLTPVRAGRKRQQYRMDIRAANRWLLSEMGLNEAPSLEMCTKENAGRFFSARQSRTTGRNLALIALKLRTETSRGSISPALHRNSKRAAGSDDGQCLGESGKNRTTSDSEQTPGWLPPSGGYLPSS